ncbi:MAG: OmpA family protein [Desulfuromonadaceae bacterium]|nr:OmpA family protein [Desulfuromonadaceae bacterium]
MKRLVLLLMMLCCIPVATFAFEANQAAQEGRFFINPMVGGLEKESTSGYNPAINYTLGGGYNYSANLSSYLDVSFAPQRRNADSDLYTASIGALYHFMPEERLVPYLTAGLGYLGINGKDGLSDENQAQFNYGVGLKYFLSKDIALNAEVKHMLDTSGEPNSLLYQAGLVFFFGKGTQLDSDNDGVLDKDDRCPNTPAGAPVDKYGCPLDSDNDGVFDYMDKCPNTPADVSVDQYGCPLDSDNDGVADYLDKCPNTPAGVSVDKFGCPLDSDNDGVADYLDKCPNTPAGAPVDKFGCPLDSDNDGVPDYLDKCPNSPAGAKVDVDGCQVKLHLVLEFATNKYEITPAHYPELDKAIKFVQKYPGEKILVAGHTDNTGAADYNKNLSLRRAEAVKAYIADKVGGKLNNLSVKGFGEEEPIADNSTDAGRKQNRRVELGVFAK